MRRSVIAFLSIAISCRTPVPVTTPPADDKPTAIPAQAPTGGRATVELDATATENGKIDLKIVDAGATAAQLAVTPLADADLRPLLAKLEPLPQTTGPAPAMRPPSAMPAPSTSPRPIALVGLQGTAIADAAPGPPPPPPPPPPAPPVVIPPLAAPELLPSGELSGAGEVYVRFAEQMVPVTDVGSLQQAPATITPAVPGSWRWVDSRVAKFTATTRFPSATAFTISVPAGIRALSGALLAKPTVGTFATPPVSFDRTGLRLVRPDAPVLLSFDQPIDPTVIATLLRVEHRGKRLEIQPTTLEHAKELWSRDPRIKLSAIRLPEHYVIVEPKTAWPAGADLKVILGVGAPSVEGPRKTTKEVVRDLFIAQPFTLRGFSCNGRASLAGQRCPATSYVSVEVSNSVAKFRAEQVKLDGAIAEREGGVYHIRILAPDTRGKTHVVEVSDLVDEFGQPMTGPRTASFITSEPIYASFLTAESGLFTLDPRFEIPQWKVEASAVQALRIQLYRVEPADYFKYRAYEESERKTTPPGKLVYDQQLAVGPRHAGTARVDLRPALDATQHVGHVIGVATPIGAKANSYARPLSAWIQVTKLGVVARFDTERVHSWASQIDTARFLAPVSGAQTTLLVEGTPERPAAASDVTGHAALDFPAPAVKPKKPPQALLVVSADADSVFQAIDRHERTVRTNNAHWYVTDDRFTYKPKEPVYVKGWVRWSHNGVNPDITLPAAGDTVAWTLTDSKDVKLASGTAPLTAQGGFDLEATIPESANLGTAEFTLETRGDQRVWPIQIEEFRTPTFSVTLDDDVTHRGATPIYAGEAIELAATAKYYSGGGLAGARVRWEATLRAASYVPPGWEGFSFSPPSLDRYRYRSRSRSATLDSEATALTGASASSVSVGIAAVPNGEPSLLSVEATVTDLDRATIRESSRAVLVHPSMYYVGLHEHAEREEFELIVTDVDGNAVPGVAIDVAIEGISAAKLDDDESRIVDTQRCKLVSAKTAVPCAWKRRDKDTAYSVLAKVADARGRSNSTRYYVPWWKRETKGPDLTLVADKALYRPGDVAKLEIHSTVLPSQAVVTIARQGVVTQRRIKLDKETTIYEVPIDPSFIRNVHVIVDRIGKRLQSDLPERDTVETELKLDPEHSRLAVTTRPTKAMVGPGERATFEVTVKHRGKPVPGAEVALLAVDEAVLAVSDKRHADPLAQFTFDVESATVPWTTLDQIVDAGEELTKSPGFERVPLDSLNGSGYGVGGGRGGMRGRTTSVPSVMIGSPSATKIRRDFRATAVWSPKLITDANGRAMVTVNMPDSLTRFRIVALATAATRNFGKAESTIATQRALNVRATAPRFLSVGDRFSLPVVVQNLDRTPRTIDVGVRAANLISSGPAGKRVTVPPGQRAELRFEFRAGARGRATIQTVAQSGELYDASQIDLPIYVPATTESFATYGIVDGDQPAFEQLAVPAGLIPDVGGVETDLFASQISSLLDAFYYLQEYPFECAEQRSSRVLANALLVDVLDGFAAPGRPSRVEIDAQRARDLRELERDHQAGGWGYFYRTSVDPFVTQQVIAALIAAGAKGKWLDSAIADLAKANLDRIATLERFVPPKLPAEAPSTISLAAAELATLSVLKPRTALALRLHAVATKLGVYPVDAKARVLALLAKQPAAAAVRKELLAQLLSAAREDAATATITTSYRPDERLLLVSAAKTTALVLDALIREAPQHALIPKLARGLLDNRKRGRWMSTQENLAVLQAMRRYFDTYEKTAPDFTGKLWVGNAGYAEHGFAKRDERARVQVPWTQLSGTAHTLAVSKTGPGRLYYRVGIQYAPSKLDLPPLDAGFVVRRSYKAFDRPSDVTRTADGNYKVKLGSLVVITLEVLSTSHRYAVALVDPLPAGFESVSRRLATSEAGTFDTANWDHINLRDNRSEGFAMSFAEGSRRFTYTVRATTPGTFAVAPAKAEEMYSPETFGRTSGAMVTIE